MFSYLPLTCFDGVFMENIEGNNKVPLLLLFFFLLMSFDICNDKVPLLDFLSDVI